MSKFYISHDGKTSLSSLYNDARDFLKHGYESVWPREKKRPRMISTNNLFGQRKKRQEIITTADIRIKKTEDEKIDLLTSNDLDDDLKLYPDYLERRKQREKARKRDSGPFGWAK